MTATVHSQDPAFFIPTKLLARVFGASRRPPRKCASWPRHALANSAIHRRASARICNRRPQRGCFCRDAWHATAQL